MDNYLGSLNESKVKSLRELVQWNKDHAEEALTDGNSVWPRIFDFELTSFLTEYPNQILLEQGLDFPDSVEAREKPLAHSKAVAANFDEMIEKYDIDIIIAPGDCMFSTYSAAGGKHRLCPYVLYIGVLRPDTFSRISNRNLTFDLPGLQW